MNLNLYIIIIGFLQFYAAKPGPSFRKNFVNLMAGTN